MSNCPRFADACFPGRCHPVNVMGLVNSCFYPKWLNPGLARRRVWTERKRSRLRETHDYSGRENCKANHMISERGKTLLVTKRPEIYSVWRLHGSPEFHSEIKCGLVAKVDSLFLVKLTRFDYRWKSGKRLFRICHFDTLSYIYIKQQNSSVCLQTI